MNIFLDIKPINVRMVRVRLREVEESRRYVECRYVPMCISFSWDFLSIFFTPFIFPVETYGYKRYEGGFYFMYYIFSEGYVEINTISSYLNQTDIGRLSWVTKICVRAKYRFCKQQRFSNRVYRVYITCYQFIIYNADNKIWHRDDIVYDYNNRPTMYNMIVKSAFIIIIIIICPEREVKMWKKTSHSLDELLYYNNIIS